MREGLNIALFDLKIEKGATKRGWKGKEMDFPFDSPEEKLSCQYIDFSQVIPASNVWPKDFL